MDVMGVWRDVGFVVKKMAYLRPNLLHMGKLVFVPLLLLLLARRSGGGSAGAHAPVNVLLFLFGWFEDLKKREQVRLGRRMWGIQEIHQPGRSRASSRRRSSSHPRCRIHRSS